MRTVAALVLAMAAGAAHAQSDSGNTERCVSAQIGSAIAYNCLNESLAHLADRAHGARETNTLTATSPAPAVGTFNRSATAERMGNTFGHSVYSERPPPPVYIAPPPR